MRLYIDSYQMTENLLKLFKMNAIDQKKNVCRFGAARNKRVWNRQKHECEYRFVFVCV